MPPITRKLLSKEPVCLALEWDPDAHPIYYGKPAPDTLVLFPELHRRAPVDSADAWGLIQLAPSQRDRNGGGWWWWIAKSGLQIRGELPTMEGIGIWSAEPDAPAPANWVQLDRSSENGQVGLRPYECGPLPRSAP